MSGNLESQFFKEEVGDLRRSEKGSGVVRWSGDVSHHEEVKYLNQGVGSNSFQGKTCVDNSGDMSILPLNKCLASMEERLNVLWRLTGQQKGFLGLSPIVSSSDVSFFLSDALKHAVLTTSRECGESQILRLRDQRDVESPRDVSPTSKPNISYQELFLERDRLQRVLADAQNEIDDLNYEHDQQIELLQKELIAHRYASSQLREMDNAHQEKIHSMTEKVAQLNEDVKVLQKKLWESTDKENVLREEKDFLEKSYAAQIRPLEDTLAAANQMNSVLLQNTEKLEIAYQNALTEVESLRKMLTETKVLAESERQKNKEKLGSMETEIISLRLSKERAPEDKLIECTKLGRTAAALEDEFNRLRSALRDANNLVERLRQENAHLADILPASLSKQDVSVQCDGALWRDAGANAFKPVEDRSILLVQELTDQIQHFSQEREARDENIETLKQSHAIETVYLTEKLLRTETDLKACQQKLKSFEQLSSFVVESCNRGLIVDHEDRPASGDKMVPTSPNRQQRGSCCTETEVSGNTKQSDDILCLNSSYETTKDPSMIERRPPITVSLSPRVRARCETKEL